MVLAEQCISVKGRRLTCLHMHMQADGAGNLTMRFTGPPSASTGAACSAGVQWPQLDGLLLLGAGAVDPATLTVQVRGPGQARPAPRSLRSDVPCRKLCRTSTELCTTGAQELATGAGAPAHPVPVSQAAFDPAVGLLNVTSLGARLSCPGGVVISWRLSAGATATKQEPPQQ